MTTSAKLRSVITRSASTFVRSSWPRGEKVICVSESTDTHAFGVMPAVRHGQRSAGMPDPALRDRLAEIIKPKVFDLSNEYSSLEDWHCREDCREIIDAILASEERLAREAVVRAAEAYFPDGLAMREGDRIAVGMGVLTDLAAALARLAAVRGTT